MKTKRLATLSENSTPAFIVAGNDDLLTEILKRLPVISLLRFKSVCKHWLSLITDPQFTLLLNPNLRHPSGFFLPCNNDDYDFMPFDGENLIKPPFTRLHLSGTTFRILSSCNGLFCCRNFSSYFYIYNPCNQKFVMLPQPQVGARNAIFAVNLVFDPSKSPNLYKVVCLVVISRAPEPIRIGFHIYSSATGNWKPSVDFELNFRTIQINHEVYLNGTIHWYSSGSSMRYFNVDQERFHYLMNQDLCLGTVFTLGSLRAICISLKHMVQISFSLVFLIWKGIILRYRISLNALLNTYPEMIFDAGAIEQSSMCYRYKVLYVFEDESRENSYMVLYIPGKIIRYSLVEKTYKLLFDYNPLSGFDYFSSPWPIEAVFPFIPSLHTFELELG